MYTEFYNLKEKPFELTPSPRYLFLGEIHKEALAFLTYGVVERKGFILLTGEVGTGKTTMVQALLASLDRNVQCVYISNPLLSSQDFFDYLAFSAFKKKVRFKSKADFLVEFEEFLKRSLRDQKTFLLIIDEAQRLSFELMEEIRLLSNMETADEKLINVFLVGQPELNEKLAEPRARALLQRISVRHHIEPLDLDQTKEYVVARMKTAGCEDPFKIFPKSAIKALYNYSEGYPRMINILADNALLLGYSREKRKITPSMVQECYEEIRFGSPHTETKEDEEPQGKLEMPAQKSGVLKWVALFFLIMVLVLGAALIQSGMIEDIRSFLDKRLAALLGNTGAPASQNTSQKISSPLKPSPSSSSDSNQVAVEQEGEKKQEVVPALVPMKRNQREETVQKDGFEQEPLPEIEAEPWQTVTVKPGDTLAQLATDVYGWADQKVLEFVKRHNPEITNINWIRVGQRIVFPPLSQKEEAPVYTVHIASYGPFSSAREKFLELLSKGYEAYIIPVHIPGQGRVYQVTLGNFNKLDTAEKYASELIDTGLTSFAEPIRLEVRSK